MAGGPENLVLEHLRALRADMARRADDMQGLRIEMVALRQPFAGVVTIQKHDHTNIASIKAKLDRIERGLELVE